jgi:hypothetical protein
MIDKLTYWLTKKKVQHSLLWVVLLLKVNLKKSIDLRNNKIMKADKEDGIYIRMAGDESKGECFSTDFAKVKSFD